MAHIYDVYSKKTRYHIAVLINDDGSVDSTCQMTAFTLARAGKMMGVEFTAESPELINVTDFIKKVGKEVAVKTLHQDMLPPSMVVRK